MLQALKRAYAINPNNATLHGCIIRFIKLLDKKLSSANEFVRIVIQREIEKELPIIGKRSNDVNNDFFAMNKDSADALIAAARVYYEDSADNKTKAIELLMSCTLLKSFKLEVSLQWISWDFFSLNFSRLQHAQYIHSLIKSGAFGSSEAEMEIFLEKSRILFPVAIDFKPYSPEEPSEAIDTTNEDAKTNSN